MSMSRPQANILLVKLNQHNKEVKLAAIYALGEGRCQESAIISELMELMQSTDEEISIAAIKAFGRITR